jgi:predicted pyridoxine 5'-phosphate oxidase superfamily flavin-nucleotide-binding protein
MDSDAARQKILRHYREFDRAASLAGLTSVRSNIVRLVSENLLPAPAHAEQSVVLIQKQA